MLKKRALLPVVCLAVLAAGLLVIGPIATAQDHTGNASFNTPEETITFFMEAFARGDVSTLLQACAVDEMSENFRFDLYVDRLRALHPQAPAPSDYPFYAELNKAQFASQILFQVRFLAYGLLTTEQDLLDARVVIIDQDETTAFTTNFIGEVDPARLAQLQVMRIGVPNPDSFYNERNVENWSRTAQMYGADEFTERVVLLLFEGEYYFSGFQLLRYGDDWKISGAASNLGGTNPMGTPQITTEADFQDLITGD